MGARGPRRDDRAADAAIGALARRLADHAGRLGLAVERIALSRTPGSHTRYLCFRDRLGRFWELRVSDHSRYAAFARTRPSYDLVSDDGVQGEAHAAAFLAEVADGQRDWSDPRATLRCPRLRRRRP